ncbi:hypothetical protein KCU73_g7346, partial [Aureobasidium melanogenum]
MPSFPNINDIYIITNSSEFSSQAVYLPKLLNDRIEELSFSVIPDQVIDSAANQHIPSPEAHLPWLRAVEQRCTNLSSLELNMRLPPSAITDLGRLLVGSSLKKLYLGPSVEDNLDDVTVALVLAQQSINDLTINYPISLQALEMLGQQCGGLPMLNQLQYLQMHCTNHAAEVLTLLLSLTLQLRLFYLTIHPSDTDKPWVMPTAGFEALTQLPCLSDLSNRIECAKDANIAIRGADLLALTRVPRLLSFNLQSSLPHPKDMFLICETSAAEVIHLMRSWQLLEPNESKLNVWIEQLPCTMAQAQVMWQMYSTIKDLNFSIRYFIIEEEPDLFTLRFGSLATTTSPLTPWNGSTVCCTTLDQKSAESRQ